MSWDEIATLSESGEASTYLNVGDEKTITATIEDVKQELTFVILGFNHDDLADGTGKAGISIGLKGLTVKRDYRAYSACYYNESDYHKTILPEILSNLPTELKQSIKTVSKGCIYNSKPTYTVDCQLFLFSVNELCGDGKLSTVSTQYEYCKNNSTHYGYSYLSRDYQGGYNVEFTPNGEYGGYTTDDQWNFGLSFGFCI